MRWLELSQAHANYQAPRAKFPAAGFDALGIGSGPAVRQLRFDDESEPDEAVTPAFGTSLVVVVVAAYLSGRPDENLRRIAADLLRPTGRRLSANFTLQVSPEKQDSRPNRPRNRNSSARIDSVATSPPPRCFGRRPGCHAPANRMPEGPAPRRISRAWRWAVLGRRESRRRCA